jgi:hypothetical protein
MKKKLKPHKDNHGPVVDVDLSEVAVVNMYGQRTSEAGWVEVNLVLKSGVQISVKMTPDDYDVLLSDWEKL